MSMSVLLLTHDEQLSSRLSVDLSECFMFKTFGRPIDLNVSLREEGAAAVVLDFRRVTGGGHHEAGLLEQLGQVPNVAATYVLVDGFSDEPLERQLACSDVVVLRTAEALEGLGKQLRTDLSEAPRVTLPSPAVPRAAAKEPNADDSASFALEGLTRRFETNCPRLRMMLADLEVAARHDVTILLIGETGSGKTFLSKLVHEISLRRDEPFLPVACGALPSDLIESEMFGHVKGAFTSAHADKDGKFVAAGRGTILLDEIDVLGPEQQVKLLRVMESGEFEPVGSNRTVRSEARLIVASNLDLQPLVEQKKFRPDLYYRLNMMKFEIPPLRARQPDIIPLAKRFVREQAAKHQVEITSIDDSLYAALLNYPWPGNVRELEHVIQRAVIYCRDGILSDRQLPSHIVACQPGPSQEGGPRFDRFVETDFVRNNLVRQVAHSEREIIEQTLFQNNHSRTTTAKALGISRVTLYNKMKKYGIQ